MNQDFRDEFARRQFVTMLGLDGYAPHEIDIMWTADAFLPERRAAYRLADLKLLVLRDAAE